MVVPKVVVVVVLVECALPLEVYISGSGLSFPFSSLYLSVFSPIADTFDLPLVGRPSDLCSLLFAVIRDHGPLC